MPLDEPMRKKIEQKVREYPYSRYEDAYPTFEGFLGRFLYVKIQDELNLFGRAFKAEIKQYIRATATNLNDRQTDETRLQLAEGHKPREGSHANFRKKRARPEDGSVRVLEGGYGYRPDGENLPAAKRQKFSLVDTTDYDSDEEVDDPRWYFSDYGSLSMWAPGTPPRSPVREAELLDDDDLPVLLAPSNPSTHPASASGIKTTGRQAISPAQVRLWKATDRKTFRPDQQTVMGCSAGDAAARANLDIDHSERGWEWLHLISFQMGGMGGYPQRAENFVAGTYDANSEMIGLEEAIKEAILKFDVTLDLVVSCPVVVGTHVGTGRMTYDVSHDGKTANYGFDVLSVNRPFSGVNVIWYQHLVRALDL